MPWQSTAPDVIDALVAAFRTATGIEAVNVVDGPEVSGSRRTEAVMVGWDDDDLGVPAFDSGTFDRDSFRADPLRERYTVNCAVRVRHGGKDVPAARRRAFQIKAACLAVLMADPSLGGLVLTALPGAWTGTQRTVSGAEFLLPFAIEIDAYTT